jgi:hypothetical protein
VLRSFFIQQRSLALGLSFIDGRLWCRMKVVFALKSFFSTKFKAIEVHNIAVSI